MSLFTDEFGSDKKARRDKKLELAGNFKNESLLSRINLIAIALCESVDIFCRKFVMPEIRIIIVWKKLSRKKLIAIALCEFNGSYQLRKHGNCGKKWQQLEAKSSKFQNLSVQCFWLRISFINWANPYQLGFAYQKFKSGNNFELWRLFTSMMLLPPEPRSYT